MVRDMKDVKLWEEDNTSLLLSTQMEESQALLQKVGSGNSPTQAAIILQSHGEVLPHNERGVYSQGFQ